MDDELQQPVEAPQSSGDDPQSSVADAPASDDQLNAATDDAMPVGEPMPAVDTAAVWGATPPPPPAAPTPTPSVPTPSAAPTPWWAASGSSESHWHDTTAPNPSADATSAAHQPTAPPYMAPTAPAAARGTSGVRAGVIGAIAGALVASLVTGGLFLAFRDDSGNDASTQTPSTLKLASSTSGSGNSSSTTNLDVRSVIARVRPAVVAIRVETNSGTGGGTGFIVDSNGTIVTNAHVVEDATSISVTRSTGDVLAAKVRGVDTGHDLAVIKIDGVNLPTVTLGDSDAAQVGDPVVAIGNALGLGISVTTGIVSALDRSVDEPNGNTILGALQTDAAINPGNSGGPLVNANGEVIGINTAIAAPDSSNNVGFAISISSARTIIEDLANGRTPRDALLGVQSDDVTPSRVEELNLKVDHGAIVTSVEPGTAADTAGIHSGDVIVQVDGLDVHGRDELRRYIRRHRPGDRIEVVLYTEAGDRKSLTVTLGANTSN